MTTSIITRIGDSPEEGIKAPVKAVSSGILALFDTGMMIAGYVVQDNDRIAVNAQASSADNGIYIAHTGKDWTRATDFNNSDDVINGQLMTDANTSSVYTISTVNPWNPGVTDVDFGLLLTPVGFFWGAIGGTLSNQADLQAELDALAPLVHTHVEADITDLQPYLLDAAGSIALDGEFYARRDAAWEIIDFSVFAPTVHTHVEADITDLQPYLLDAAGSIANNDELYARANNGWQAFSTSSGTVGEIIAWPDTDPPDNFLICDGSSQNAVTFADLFAVLGYKYGGSGANFNLPDLRGEFIRGANNGSGSDPGAASRTDRGDGTTGDNVGTQQAAQVGPHSHTFSAQQNIGGFTDNGGAPDQRSTQQNASTGSTGSGIGSDTAPRNVYMNYIIRWTGGGSGITSPPTVEVQDMGVVLTTAVQLLNFEGFTMTNSPNPDEVTITFGASPNSALFCPGYAFNFVNTIQWSINGFEVANLFRQGRRLQFTDGASLYFGIITAVSESGGNTTMTMSMEGGDVLTNTITEVCLTTSATAWAPIAQDPFGGTRINDIKTGQVDATQYWVICGNGGKVAYSSDGGINWTLVATGTTEDLNCMVFDTTNEVFWCAGDAGVLFSSVGLTDLSGSWTLDTTTVPARTAANFGGNAGNSNINGITHTNTTEGLSICVEATNTGGYYDYFSDDEGASWISRASIGSVNAALHKTLHPLTAGAGSFGVNIVSYLINNTSSRSHAAGTTGNWGIYDSGLTGVALSAYFWADIRGNNRIYCTGFDYLISRGGWTASTVNQITGAIRDFAYSSAHDRLVGVGVDAQIIYIEGSNFNVVDAFVQVDNGFNPLADVTAVDWNETDGVFVAVADNGQICRSSNGLGSALAVAPTYTGFTLIAADPFTGSPITHIKSGAIAGQVYWIACGGSQIFRSIDAGVTWSAITHGCSGTVVSLAYSASEESFVAGFSGGDLSYTFDGATTWTADTTSVAAIGHTGSNSIKTLYYPEDTGQWLICIPSNTGGIDTQYRTSDITAPAWASLDGAVVSQNQDIETEGAKGGGDNRFFNQENGTGIPHQSDGADTTQTNYLTVSANTLPRTAMKVEAATVAAAPDIHLGNAGGLISFITTTIEYTKQIFTGAVRGFAFASASSRYVAVGDANEIYTVTLVDLEEGLWYEVINPFTADINAVWYDPSDDMVIAVGSNGEIGRSTDGIS